MTEGGLAKFSQSGWEKIEVNFVANPSLDLKKVYQNGFILTDSTGITVYHIGNVASSLSQPKPLSQEAIIVKKMRSQIEIKLKHPEPVPVHVRIYDIHGKLHSQYYLTGTLLLSKADFANGVYVMEFKIEDKTNYEYIVYFF